MSYILDALKKAEAERNAGTRPSIHTTQVLAAAPAQDARGLRNAWLWAVAAIVLLAVAGLLLWFAMQHETPVQGAPAALPPMAAATPPANAAPPAPPPAATPAAPARPATAQTPEARPKPRPVRKPAEKKPAPVEPASKPAETLTEAPVPTLRELPDNIRQEIPQLAVGGYIYSANRAERSVLINKRLLHEGDEVAPGLTLERMTPSGMVFNYKGYRYRSGY
jgi:general secretion pathway protein B